MERMQEPFAFTGNARDYFRIWIVNLFLTIATLGLYSPWAKVRKKRYLYGHTWLAGSNFDYHGNPWAILKGRLVAFTAFVAYTLATHFSPRAGAVVLLVMMPAIPWLILRSFAFNAANSSWRHLRFGYEGRYADALRAIVPFLPIPIATLFFPLEPGRVPTPRDAVVALLPSLIFLVFYPYVRARLVHLRLDGTRLGEERCRCTLRTSSFYGVYAIAALLVMGLGVFAGLAASVGGLAAVFAGSPDLGMVSIFVAYMSVAVVVMAFTQSRTSNLVFENTALGEGIRFSSRLKARGLARLYGLNVIAILCTAGLAIPWAVTRTLRYRASCVAVEAGVPLEHFTRRTTDAVSATGEEMGDMFALDVSL
jgi:uncharacterized membrane protein YjgN (DUF898 family)